MYHGEYQDQYKRIEELEEQVANQNETISLLNKRIKQLLQPYGPVTGPLYEAGDTAHSAFYMSNQPEVQRYMQKIGQEITKALTTIAKYLKDNNKPL